MYELFRLYTAKFKRQKVLQKFYIGATSDLQKRLAYHNHGANKSTRHRRPFKLVYSEEFADKHQAFQREYFLKSPKGFLEKKSIVENI